MTPREMGVQRTLHEPRRIPREVLHGRIREFEAKHEMLTVEFEKLWRSGDLPETPAFSEWYRLTVIAAGAGVAI